jgi:FKBP-type peptidyl-prolyl cis-trans isomerase (trigger factor)
MAIDIKEKIEELVEKIKKNPAMLKKFKENPVKVVEELVGIDLPDELVEKVVDGVKAKITMDKVGDALGALGGLFGKK